MSHSVIERIKEFATQLATVLVDAGFLAGWAWAQHRLGRVLDDLTLDAIDEVTIVVLRVLFAITTLAPVVAWTYSDIYTIVMRAKGRMRRAKADALEEREHEVFGRIFRRRPVKATPDVVVVEDSGSSEG